MALGNQIGDFKAKTGSRTVRDTGPGYAKVELNMEAQVSGKLTGMMYYTVNVTHYADGTGEADVKVALMGPEGEMASGTGRALGVFGSGGKITIRGVTSLHSDHPKWSWLNTTPIAVESVSDMQTGEETGRLYEWK